jgi:hypothetical protein
MPEREPTATVSELLAAMVAANAQCRHAPPPRDGWTFETLLAHITMMIAANDRRYIEMFSAMDKATLTALAAAEKAVNAALAASDKAVGKAEESQLRVNVGQNEFRQQLKDQAANFVTKDMLSAVGDRVQLLENFGSKSVGRNEGVEANRQTGRENWGIWIAVGLLVCTFVSALAGVGTAIVTGLLLKH